jgi:hypothetical protein
VPDVFGAFGPIIQSVLSAAPAVRGTVDAALADVLGASKPKPAVDVLLLFDKSDGRLTPAKDAGPFLYKAKPAQIVGVESWQSLATELAKYSTIGQLVIWAHGTPGSPMIDAHIMAVDKLRDLLGGSKVQVTGSILFEGCDTMQKPIDMSVTVSRIAAPGATLVGYTYSMVIRTYPVGGQTAEQVQGILNKYEGYWASEADAKKIAGKGSKDVLQRWFREALDDAPLPDDVDQRDGFVKEKSLKPKTIATAADAIAFEKLYDSLDHQPGYKVTVTDIQAVAKAQPKP